MMVPLIAHITAHKSVKERQISWDKRQACLLLAPLKLESVKIIVDKNTNQIIFFHHN